MVKLYIIILNTQQIPVLTLSVYPWGLFLKSWSMPPPILNPHFNNSRPSVSIADSFVKVIGI